MDDAQHKTELSSLGEKQVAFLLGARKLSGTAVVSLLLSSSFGLNALFYAAWLGYSVGAWALVIQGAWALSFFLLIPFARSFYGIASLHNLLGDRYGTPTRMLAAICSLVGILYLVGWEVAIARSTLASFLKAAGSVGSAGPITEVLLICLVSVTVIYTAVWGLKGNANVDLVLNTIKLVLTILVAGFAGALFFRAPVPSLIRAAFPSFSVVLGNLGLWGLVTNLLFNLAWQFVDNSSWQSIIGGSQSSPHAVERNLSKTGTVVFLTIGLLGTLLGIATSTLTGITADNIIVQAVATIGANKWLVGTVLTLLIAACVMSLVDGMLLACALTVVGDILPYTGFGKGLTARTKAAISRITLVVAAIMAVWGINFLFRLTGGSVFDFVYIVIVTQLALLGSVLSSWFTARQPRTMWLSILSGLVCGFGAVAVGVISSRQYLIDGAGTFAMASSCVAAAAIIGTAKITSRRTA